MGFLYPGALTAFALVPLLVVAYLVRERPRRVIVSSVISFYALRTLRAQRPWGWPRLDWRFVVELLILSLVVLAMAGPYQIRPRTPIAVVLDNSAAMQVREPDGVRFAQARQRLLRELPEQADLEVALYLTAPAPHLLASGLDSVQARGLISAAHPLDAPDDGAATARLLADLATSHRFSSILVASTHPFLPPVPAIFHLITVGTALPNYALGSFTVTAQSFGASALKARLSLANFSSQARTVRVDLYGDDKPLAHAQPQLAAREVSTLEFPSVSRAIAYRAQLLPTDAFSLDNVAYASAATGDVVRLLFVSPTPHDAQGLSELPGLEVTTMTPEQYSPDRVGADLIVFEYAVPKELPGANALLVMPPADDPIFGLQLARAATTQVTSWRSPDPLTDNVNFRLLQMRQAQSFKTGSWLDTVVESNAGALILDGSHQGHRYVVMGFNPFPYLGSRNLPMSILTLNVLAYLSGFGSSEVGYRTGRPWVVPSGITQIVTPRGVRYQVKPGQLFSGDNSQGFYKMSGPGGQQRLRAVNLDDLTVSDLEDRQPLKLELAPAPPAPPSTFAQRRSLTAYLLAAILLLAAGEALLIYRRPAMARTV
ncbi:MAG TPA: BatA domain-containing protein [Candidatus Binataceae bacterium]|nr:BatA domain-containing protein [Candidatus Binataceae bacterium]